MLESRRSASSTATKSNHAKVLILVSAFGEQQAWPHMPPAAARSKVTQRCARWDLQQTSCPVLNFSAMAIGGSPSIEMFRPRQRRGQVKSRLPH